ncbi:MAG TPA: rod shape-determining protein MreC [Phycisphaerae bacterium]|nr:rod shape-determining protein MreC [Phycisphaerae bacterium]
MSPKRLFLGLTLFVFLWAAVGGRTAGPATPQGPNSILMSTQNAFGGIIDTLLTPVKFIFAGAQGIANRAVARLGDTQNQNESAESLHQQIAELHDQLDQRDRQLRIDEEYLLQLQAMAPQGLSARDLLFASITGSQAGAGAGVITLDKGSMDGVQRGMPVTACVTISVPTEPVNPAEGPAPPATRIVPQATLLGMVDAVNAKTCSVRLMTDPHMKTQAVLVRRLSDRYALLTSEPCLVEGLGNGQLRCDTLDVGKTFAIPQPGDLVELLDQNWPANMRYMVLGEVTAVARKDTQILRYDLTITPRVNVNTIQSVLIVLKS